MDSKAYREPEETNFEIISSSATARPADGTESSEFTQDFVVKYKRPFKATELSDLTLVPQQEYNITSAYGCYLKTDA